MIVIAQLGGYLNRKCDGPPGFESLWKGYARFHDMYTSCAFGRWPKCVVDNLCAASIILGQAQG